MSSRDLQAVVKTQKAFINELLDRLEGKEKVQIEELQPFSLMGVGIDIQGKGYLLNQIKKLLNDPYFNGLTLEQILELAKKSIRLTDDNCKMRHKLDDIEEILEQKDLCSECKDTCCTKFSEKIKNILDK